MEETEKIRLINEVLSQTREMTLATCGDLGPWAAALVFGHDENFNLYWLSDDDARHSKDIEKNPKTAAVVTKQPTGEGKDSGLQIEGEARKLKEEEIVGAAREYFAKRGTDHMPETIKEVNKITKGRSWYILEPTKIYILDQTLLGFGREEYTP